MRFNVRRACSKCGGTRLEVGKDEHGNDTEFVWSCCGAPVVAQSTEIYQVDGEVTSRGRYNQAYFRDMIDGIRQDLQI